MAFLLVGSVPLVPFALGALPGVQMDAAFAWSASTTARAFVLVGIAKAVVVGQSRWRARLETLNVGGSAAGLAYLVGVGLGGLA